MCKIFFFFLIISSACLYQQVYSLLELNVLDPMRV